MYGCEGESGGCIRRDVGEEGGWSGGSMNRMKNLNLSKIERIDTG